MRAFVTIGAMALALAGCQSNADTVAEDAAPTASESVAAQSDSAGAEAEQPGMLIDAAGLRQVDPANGDTPLKPFGSSRQEIDTIASEALGMKPEISSNGECGAGPMDFSRYGALSLNFQDGKFVGWYLEGASDLETAEGAELGMSKADLEKLYKVTPVEDSTLGDEFTTGDGSGGWLGGFFEGGKVSSLYAGTNCFFR